MNQFFGVLMRGLPKKLTGKKTLIAAASVLVAYVLYALGVRFLLIPVLIAISAWRLPVPRVVNSYFGRVTTGFMILFALIQIGAGLQFLIFPHRGFLVLALFLVLLHLAVWIIAPAGNNSNTKIISSNDICAILAICLFLLPFTPILAGHNSINRIAQIGSTQASDGLSHYTVIAELTYSEHLAYTTIGTTYYPSGFHIADAFTQHTLFPTQESLGWAGNAWLYFSDYLIFGSLLGYFVVMISLSWLKRFKDSLVPDGWSWSKLLLVACLAPPLVLFYLLPFISEAFLNYYYICATLVSGLLFISEINSSLSSKKASLDLSKNKIDAWHLFVYLILLFGAAASWPLLMPPFAVIGFMFLLPSRLNVRTFFSQVLNLKGSPVIVAFVLLLLPIYFQLKYFVNAGSTANLLNSTGTLVQFHAMIILSGILLVIYTVISSKVDESFRRLLINIFFPLTGFLALLVLFQLFDVGSVLYYVLKVSLVLEILLVAFSIALLVSWFVQSRVYEARYSWMLPVVPLFVMLLLVSYIPNPLKDVRDLFRGHSHDVIPQYLYQDDKVFVKLGTSNKLHHYNMTVLHYDTQQGFFFADMQGPMWADLMQYAGSPTDTHYQNCINAIAKNQFPEVADPTEQAQLISLIKQCGAAANKLGLPYYVVTDAQSEPYVKSALGGRFVYLKD